MHIFTWEVKITSIKAPDLKMFQRILASSQIPAINKFRNHEGPVLPGGSVIKNLLAMQVMQKT